MIKFLMGRTNILTAEPEVKAEIEERLNTIEENMALLQVTEKEAKKLRGMIIAAAINIHRGNYIDFKQIMSARATKEQQKVNNLQQKKGFRNYVKDSSNEN